MTRQKWCIVQLNGVIYFNENVKDDRRSATERMIRLLREGGNLMYFPEGTWNLTPNLPMLLCYWGIVDIAKQEALVADEWDQYIKERFREWPYFNLEYIAGLIYRPKGITPPDEAFAHLQTLIPSRANAFLLRKR